MLRKIKLNVTIFHIFLYFFCIILDTSANIVKQERTIIAASSSQYRRNTEGDMVVLPSGKIITYFSRFTEKADDFSNSEIMSKISFDSGVTWKDYKIAQKNIRKMNTMSPSIIFMNNTIHLFFAVKNGYDDIQYYVKKVKIME